VVVKLAKLFEGKKQYEGVLSGFSQDDIIINNEGQEIKIPREKIKTVSLKA
jgi:ribosome maturation factor RimP